jgi:hypothetical protein
MGNYGSERVSTRIACLLHLGMATHDDWPLDVLGHLADDLLVEGAGVGGGTDQHGRLDLANDCKVSELVTDPCERVTNHPAA